MRAETHRSIRAHLNREIGIGQDLLTKRTRYLSLEALKETSVHVLGAAGYGKSYWLRNLIDEFVTHGQPFGLIDPHGDLYSYAVSALRRSATRPRDIVLFDPNDVRYSVAFNPLQCGIQEPGEAASLVLEACLKAWGAASFDQTPRLEGILRGMFRLLVESGLTLLESYDLLNVDNRSFRAALRDQVSDDLTRADWVEFEKLGRREKLAVVESSRNRLRRFMQSERVQLMIGQTRNTLNLREVVDDGQFLLTTLGGGLPPETQRLLGAMLVNGIFHAAKHRNPQHRRDWFLIIDECGQFATQDLANSLDELRKFGVHLILAHQRLRQLERDDADILSAVMTNAKVKVVFGGLERTEAERVARELFTGDVRGDSIKHVAYQTKFRPVFDTFEVETESWSDSDGDSDSESWSESSAAGSQRSESAAYDIDDDNRHRAHDENDVVSRTETDGASESATRSSSGGRTSQHSHSAGGSRSVVPITRHEEFREETGRQFWTAEEEWEHRTALVHGLPKREALVRVYDGPVLHIRTPDVESEHLDGPTARFKTRVLEACRYVTPTSVVVDQIRERRKEVAVMIERSEERDRPFNVKSFRE